MWVNGLTEDGAGIAFALVLCTFALYKLLFGAVSSPRIPGHGRPDARRDALLRAGDALLSRADGSPRWTAPPEVREPPGARRDPGRGTDGVAVPCAVPAAAAEHLRPGPPIAVVEPEHD